MMTRSASPDTTPLTPDDFNESTGASWFWALLFGPLYYGWHGFWGRAVLVLLLNFLIIGFVISPFLAYPAWRERAAARCHDARMLAAMEKAARADR